MHALHSNAFLIRNVAFVRGSIGRNSRLSRGACKLIKARCCDSLTPSLSRRNLELDSLPPEPRRPLFPSHIFHFLSFYHYPLPTPQEPLIDGRLFHVETKFKYKRTLTGGSSSQLVVGVAPSGNKVAAFEADGSADGAIPEESTDPEQGTKSEPEMPKNIVKVCFSVGIAPATFSNH